MHPYNLQNFHLQVIASLSRTITGFKINYPCISLYSSSNYLIWHQHKEVMGTSIRNNDCLNCPGKCEDHFSIPYIKPHFIQSNNFIFHSLSPITVTHAPNKSTMQLSTVASQLSWYSIAFAFKKSYIQMWLKSPEVFKVPIRDNRLPKLSRLRVRTILPLHNHIKPHLLDLNNYQFCYRLCS